MAKKYPSELNTRTIRIGIGDYCLLMEISRRTGVTVAEALSQALQGREQETRVPATQIPMPVFRVMARGVRLAVNSSEEAAFKIKPKGGVAYE